MKTHKICNISKFKNGIYCILFFFICACTNNKKHNHLPYYTTPDFTPKWFESSSDSISGLHKIGNFNFKDQNGRNFTELNLDGKVSITNFFFTSCGSICPKMTRNLKVIQDSFSDYREIQLISFSVMPWKDSINALKQYEIANGLNTKFWRLITGRKADIYLLGRKSFFAEEEAGYDLDSNDFLHTEHVILTDKNRHIRGVYNGTVPSEINKIIEDIRFLLSE